MLSSLTGRGTAQTAGPHRIELSFRDLSLNQGYFPQDIDIAKFKPYLACTLNDNAASRSKTKSLKWSGGFTGNRLGFDDRLVIDCDLNRDTLFFELWDDGSGLAGMLARDRLLGKSSLLLSELLTSNQLLERPITLMPVEGPSGMASSGSSQAGTGHVGIGGRISHLLHGGTASGAPAGTTSGNVVGQAPGGGMGTTGGITGTNAMPVGGLGVGGGIATVLLSARLLETGPSIRGGTAAAGVAPAVLPQQGQPGQMPEGTVAEGATAYAGKRQVYPHGPAGTTLPTATQPGAPGSVLGQGAAYQQQQGIASTATTASSGYQPIQSGPITGVQPVAAGPVPTTFQAPVDVSAKPGLAQYQGQQAVGGLSQQSATTSTTTTGISGQTDSTSSGQRYIH